jgi:adenylate cyclase
MPQETEQALPLLDLALHLDPDYALAHALAAWCHEWRFTRSGFQESERRRTFQHARAAAAGSDPTAAAIAGFSMVFLIQDRAEPLEALGRGVALNPQRNRDVFERSCAFHRGPALSGGDFRRPGSPTQPK